MGLNAFCKYFILCRESSNFLSDQLLPLTVEEREEWLDSITTHIQSQGLPTTNVEISHIELAIKVSS